MSDQNSLVSRVAQWAATRESDLDLAEAAIYIATSEYPDLDVPRQRAVLDSLAAAARKRVSTDAEPLAQLNALSAFLFDEIGFRGNETDYYDSRNSYINEVMSRRLGIPITLSLLYIETGKRLGLPLEALSVPGHMVVRHRDLKDAFVDSFHGGILLNKQECIDRFKQVTQSDAWNDRYLDPIGNRAFVARMLRNLKAAYARKRDLPHSLVVLDLLVAFCPDIVEERRDRGLLHYHLGHTEAALVDLRTYLASGPYGAEARRIYELVEKLSHSTT